MSGEGSHWRPTPAQSEPRPVADALNRVAKGLGMPPPDSLRAVFGEWGRIVGEAISLHAWPVTLKEDTLVIGVDQPGWATQLRYMETDLLRRVAEVAGPGVVASIEVRVRPGGRPDRPTPDGKLT